MPYNSKEKKSKYDKNRREKFRKFVNNIKKEIGSCKRCGYNKHIELCDFHHVGEKKFRINRKSACRSQDSIKEEIKQCILLCKNCHAEEHMEEWFSGKNQYNL